jgi:hypothetical protein
MSDSEQGGLIARAAALRAATPRAEDLISLPEVASAIAVALRLTACEAGRLLVDELNTGAAAGVHLFRGYYGGRIAPIDDHREPARPGDFNYSRTHWPSSRDNELNALPLAMLMGFALGDQSHPDSRRAADLMMLRKDFDRCFFVPLVAHLQATNARSAVVEPLQVVQAAPAAVPVLEQDAVSAPSAFSSKWKDPRGWWTEAAKQEMRRLRASGCTGDEIAAQFGTTRSNVLRLIGSELAEKAIANSVRRNNAV